MSTTDRPNVLCIAVDDLNAWPTCLGLYPAAKTPNIDALAARGTCFRNAFCPAPICVPARHAVLSGVAPYRSGCYLNVWGGLEDKQAWRESPALQHATNLPAWFREHGYRTLGYGKIFHPEPPESPWDDQSHGGVIMPHQFADPTERIRDVSNTTDFAYFWGHLPDDTAADLPDEHTVERSLAALAQDHDRPFFLAPGFHRPHVPLTVHKRFFDLYDPDEIELPDPDSDAFARLSDFAKALALTAGGYETVGCMDQHIRDRDLQRRIVHAYLASVSYVDDCIGRVLDALAASPHADNTIVALWVDHGWSLGEHHHWQKWALWRSSAQVPFIISRPGDHGQACDIPVSTIDLMPTLSALCGLPARSEWDGISVVPQLEDPTSARTAPAITTYGPGNHAIRTSAGTLIRYSDQSEELYASDDRREETDLGDQPAWQETRDQLRTLVPADPVPPLHHAGRDPMTAIANLQHGDLVPLGNLQDSVQNRAITIEADLRLNGEQSLIAAMHGISAGFALFTRERRLHFAVRDVPRPLDPATFTPQDHVIASDQRLADRPLRVRLHMQVSGETSLEVDGETVAEGTLPGGLTHQPVCSFMAGEWHHAGRGYDFPAGDAPMCGAFPGELERVSIRFG